MAAFIVTDGLERVFPDATPLRQVQVAHRAVVPANAAIQTQGVTALLDRAMPFQEAVATRNESGDTVHPAGITMRHDSCLSTSSGRSNTGDGNDSGARIRGRKTDAAEPASGWLVLAEYARVSGAEASPSFPGWRWRRRGPRHSTHAATR